MVGHYLLTLCPAAEHDVLTGKMAPGSYGDATTRCLVGWAADKRGVQCAIRVSHVWTQWRYRVGRDWNWTASVEECYDNLCKRFGTQRVNQAIRNRILSNIARRELAPVAVGLGA